MAAGNNDGMQVRRLFEAVCDLPPRQWRERLQALSDDPALVEEALSLLQAQTASFDRALRPLGELMAALPEAELQVGDRLGQWQLVERLASGGMGTVFVAERVDQLFRQRVAIKLLRDVGIDPGIAGRLAEERRILAGLEHPGIARLFDGGTTPSGHPYLVMEYIDGLPLDAHCEQHGLGLAERLELFLRVCRAVQAAHQGLVVHCDLKPSNILVRDAVAPVLLDFGIARLLGAEGEAAAGFCTPAYASPELLQGGRVGIASDVFSLGVLLVELLARRRSGRGDHGGGMDSLQSVPPPSALAPADCPWRRQLKGDLDAIAAKACALQPDQRYSTVEALAADVGRYLARRPVAAASGGRLYRARRFLQRHRVTAGMAAFAALALAAGLAVAVWQARQARAQRDTALVESAKSRAMLDFMAGLFEQADPAVARGHEVTARELLAQGTARMRDRFDGQPQVRAELLGAMADAHRGLGYYREALPLADEAVALSRKAGVPELLQAQELRRARILHHLGRYAEALAVLDRLQAQAQAPGRSSGVPLRAGIAHARALALQATNRLDEAEQAYRQAYALRRSASGSVDRGAQETALRLVSLYVLRKQYPQAETLARSTLAAVRASTGGYDPHRAEALDALAMVLANTGPLREAEALRREELAIRRAVYGDAHPSTAGARNDLAGVLYAQGRLQDAADIYRQVLEARRAQYGDAHPAVATVANNLAVVELEAGRAAAGLAPAREALSIRTATYGTAHHGTAISLHTLGAIELELGDPAALRHLKGAVESWQAAMGADTDSAAGPLRDLARARLVFGQSDPDCAAAERAWTLSQGQEPARLAYVDAIRAACALAAGRPGAKGTLAAKADALRALVEDGDPRLQRLATAMQAARGAGSR